jgi:hypothetical protein
MTPTVIGNVEARRVDQSGRPLYRLEDVDEDDRMIRERSRRLRGPSCPARRSAPKPPGERTACVARPIRDCCWHVGPDLGRVDLAGRGAYPGLPFAVAVHHQSSPGK